MHVPSHVNDVPDHAAVAQAVQAVQPRQLRRRLVGRAVRELLQAPVHLHTALGSPTGGVEEAYTCNATRAGTGRVAFKGGLAW